MNLETFATAIDVGLRVLSRHLLCFVALLMTFGLCCWSMAVGTWIAASIAGGFGAIIFLPILARSMPGAATDGKSAG